MSGSLNKVILIGNLGKDPELKMTASGQPLARFSLATTETWKSNQGEKKQRTEWHNIVVWGRQAEIAEKYLRKGRQILVEGSIQYGEYTDKDQVKRYSTSIRCDHFVMLGRADEGSRQSSGGGGGYDRHPSHGSGEPDYDEPMPPPQGGYDDDIPF